MLKTEKDKTEKMIVKDYVGVQRLLSFIDSQPFLAFDTETTGLNVRKDKVIGFSVSNATMGFYVSHLVWNGEKLEEVINRDMCVTVLKRFRSDQLITFNGSFDLRIVQNYFGVDLCPALYGEVQLARHTHNENLNPYEGLKEIASKMLGEDSTIEQKALQENIAKNLGKPEEFYKADLDVLAAYAIKDTLLTFRLHQVFESMLKSEGTYDFYVKDEVMPLYKWVTIPMEQRGVRLDMELLQTSQREIAVDIAEIDAEIRQLIKPHTAKFERWYLDKEFPCKRTGPFVQHLIAHLGLSLPQTAGGKFSLTAKNLSQLPQDHLFVKFMNGTQRLPDEIVLAVQRTMAGDQELLNLQSKHHLKKIFFDELGEMPLSYTEETRQPQLDDEFLESIRLKYDFVPKLLDYNKLNKIKATYIDRFIEQSENGVFYAHFQQHTTISGRYSGDLQQLPRQSEDKDDVVSKYQNRIRKFFVSRPNYDFIDDDYNSLEPHIFAHVSGDQELKNVFLRGEDLYSRVAIGAYGLKNVSADKSAPNYLGKVDKQKRQDAKEFTLGIPYGKTPYALKFSLNCTEQEALDVYNNYLSAFPDLAAWMERQKQQCLTKGFVESETGRIRHMSDIPSLYTAWGDILLNPLKLHKKFGDNPTRLKQMKYLASKVKNSVNNSRNFPIQSLAASITNRACVAMMKKFKSLNIDACIIAQIHDQILIEAPSHLAQEISDIVQDCMENTYKISLPLKAIPAIAKNFADGH